MAGETSNEVASHKFHELGFAEFVALVQPSASINRLPGIAGDDVLVYEVYLNGKDAKSLSANLQCQRYEAELLHSFVEKVGLDPTSFRDTILMSEMMALRHAWQTTVYEGNNIESARSGVWQLIEDKVLADWPTVKDFTHPVFANALQDHKAHLEQLKPALKTAGMILGVEVKDLPPQEINKGTIVSQNGSFTVMNMGEGNVVAHTNKSLESLPRVGDEVTIAYYRGQGQVFVNREVKISPPYLHDEHGDLAIEVTDLENGRKQILLFNGVAAFAHFAHANGVGKPEVESAIELMSQKAAQQNLRAPREPRLPVSIDRRTGAVSMDYVERGVLYTALFTSEKHLHERAGDFDLDKTNPGLKLPDNVLPLEVSGPVAMEKALVDSETRVKSMLQFSEQAFSEVLSPKIDNSGPYSGLVIAQSEFHVAQDVGKGRAIIHSKFDLDKVPSSGYRMSVTYREGQGRVETRPMGKTQGVTR